MSFVLWPAYKGSDRKSHRAEHSHASQAQIKFVPKPHIRKGKTHTHIHTQTRNKNKAAESKKAGNQLKSINTKTEQKKSWTLSQGDRRRIAMNQS